MGRLFYNKTLTTMKQYIAYIWCDSGKTAMLSIENEDFTSFKERVKSCYSNWYYTFSEFKEIFD